MRFSPGDIAVYRMQKHSTRPGPRAYGVHPAKGGDTYTYVVDKFWIVEAVRDEVVLLRTATGKTHQVRSDDRDLRKPSLREYLWLHTFERRRFKALNGVLAS